MSALDWQWTNGAHTEARADRWFAFFVYNEWRIGHDDFPLDRPLCLAHEGGINARGYNADARARKVLKQFLAWAKSQPAPKPTLEHREGEYVHQQDESGFDYLFQYADETWWIVRDAVVGSDDKRSRRDMADRMYRTVISHGFLSPGTITKAQPPEPTTFGYVGYVTDDHDYVWDVVRRGHTGSYVTYARDDGCWREDKGIDGNHASLYWSDIRALGTFTAVTP